MKKIFLILFILVLCSGCVFEKEELDSTPKKEEVKEEVKEVYKDNNNVPISFYQLNGNTLNKVTSITGNYGALDDVLFLQLFPSSDEVVSLNNDFSVAYHDIWVRHYSNHPVKVGFSLSFSLSNGEEIFYNILDPNHTMDHWEYFMAYLYDDYANREKLFYSHLEMPDYNENTLFTAFKLQCGGYCQEVSSPVVLTAYTYDTDDDFVDEHYRGNQQAQVKICLRDGICS